ncbi:hypothetical protein H5410_009815 [Solanum commersonii]|uniref:Uncharacterized protein n=1 Tax=Solanum commersonii TaxID=4109 RepID=A0A9J6AJ02_SOLCO|nr:hypothetical protein H5410_009815 [Solanum commersonii]
MKWFKKGHKNTVFFYAYRYYHFITEAINIFKDQFRETHEATNYSMIQNIPKIITEIQNYEIERVSIKEEMKQVVLN